MNAHGSLHDEIGDQHNVVIAEALECRPQNVGHSLEKAALGKIYSRMETH